MTVTFETLYNDLPSSADYDRRRRAAVRSLTRVLRGYARYTVRDISALAEELITRAEESGRVDGNLIDVELPSRFSAHGNPMPISILA